MYWSYGFPLIASSASRRSFGVTHGDPPPPVVRYCGVHYLWSAFVCFFILGLPPPPPRASLVEGRRSGTGFPLPLPHTSR